MGLSPCLGLLFSMRAARFEGRDAASLSGADRERGVPCRTARARRATHAGDARLRDHAMGRGHRRLARVSARYGIDVLPDKLLYASVTMCPTLGGKALDFNPSGVASRKGV
ncbi:hypothetical protein, partial [Burkholderia sp. Ac-20345]|uniref:hypothetical protein n=1 Tax=Burkholderia sp. Ac-20345 TaxID=2703891 RepID=UPI00197B31ED